MATALDRRIEKLVTRHYSRTLASTLNQPQLDGLDDPDHLSRALLNGWAVDGLGGWDDEGLDGFFKKIVSSLKRTVITAPLKAIKATVQTITTGSLAPMKAAIKEEVKGIKSDLVTVAPVAAVVANVVPGIGQVVSVGIAAGGALLKAKEDADKQKAAQAAAEAENATAIAAAQAQQAQALAAQQASDALRAKSMADAQAAQDAAAKAQADALEAQRQASLSQQANIGFQRSAANNLFTPGMSANDMANVMATQQLQQQGYNFASPEAQGVIGDTVAAYQPMVASMAGDFDLKKWWPALAVAGVLFVMHQKKGRRRHAR